MPETTPLGGHYGGKVECIDAMETTVSAWALAEEPEAGLCFAQVLRYLMRPGKGQLETDIQKARDYLIRGLNHIAEGTGSWEDRELDQLVQQGREREEELQERIELTAKMVEANAKDVISGLEVDLGQALHEKNIALDELLRREDEGGTLPEDLGQLERLRADLWRRIQPHGTPAAADTTIAVRRRGHLKEINSNAALCVAIGRISDALGTDGWMFDEEWHLIAEKAVEIIEASKRPDVIVDAAEQAVAEVATAARMKLERLEADNKRLVLERDQALDGLAKVCGAKVPDDIYELRALRNAPAEQLAEGRNPAAGALGVTDAALATAHSDVILLLDYILSHAARLPAAPTDLVSARTKLLNRVRNRAIALSEPTGKSW